jgi:hypothetical protein
MKIPVKAGMSATSIASPPAIRDGRAAMNAKIAATVRQVVESASHSALNEPAMPADSFTIASAANACLKASP